MQKITIAAQMFSFRNYIKTPAGVRNTFRRLKQMGYDAIQLSGSIAPMPTAARNWRNTLLFSVPSDFFAVPCQRA